MQTDTLRDGHIKQIYTNRHTDMKTETDGNTGCHKNIYIYIYRKEDSLTNRQTQKDRQTDQETDRSRQLNKNTNKERLRPDIQRRKLR